MNVVERQLKAYNEKDINRFIDCYSDDIVIYEFPDKVRFASKTIMRKHYQKLFDTYPDMNAEIVKRIEQGFFVIDHEKITGRSEDPLFATAIYEVQQDIIVKVWFL
ncbi:nuclear transport factor 2 family protein [Bacillus sp. T33-2]|uniref:nuclear transport factor 2 family protein n=1 Tax=Bacillus sp. T33-2 TaxID=2054168 RepID=UPI000C7632F7|nr:nuclear transport factor 2 family protein [Bacillus sp. T33-2]PLR94874.1 steroid delta-isomerase [Bacillus sp. T33-2]